MPVFTIARKPGPAEKRPNQLIAEIMTGCFRVTRFPRFNAEQGNTV